MTVKIEELTEQEILNLTNEEIEMMIKVKMAEEGIKFTSYPEKPVYHQIEKPTTKAYYCNLLGLKFSFTDMNELLSVLSVVNTCKSICSIDNNYDLPDGFKNFMRPSVENANWSQDAGDSIIPITVYTNKEYCEIKEQLTENSKLKKQFEYELKAYNADVDSAKWIRDEINGRVNEVNEKYYKLGSYVRKFKHDYLPLSDGNEEIAMNFLEKAYSLTEEEKSYVLANYNN